MALNISIVEKFTSEHEAALKDKALLRHDRYRMLAELRDHLQSSLNDYLAFEAELHSLVMDRIEKARTYRELLACHNLAVTGIQNYFQDEDTVIDVHDLFRIVRDGLTIKVLRLVETAMARDGYGKPPVAYAWAGLGSEGRDEQTMITDQDNLVIYDDGIGWEPSDLLRERFRKDAKTAGSGKGISTPTDKELIDHYFEIFSQRAVDGLQEVGFDKCTGNVMPSNDRWRGSISDFTGRLQERLTYGRGIIEPLDIIILTDARPIAGEHGLLRSFLDYFFKALKENSLVMKDFYTSAVLMPTALSFFGNFKTEKSGEHKDKFNIKLLGWAPLILAVRMVAITHGIYETNTLKRIRLMRERNVIKKEMEIDLAEAYLTLVRFRIMNQANNNEGGPSNTNYLKPDMLGGEEQGKLRKAMRTVESFQKYIQEVLLFGQPI
jgi:CBS domain-containing protein